MPRIDYRIECNTEADAIKVKEDIEGQYPPPGYGTYLKVSCMSVELTPVWVVEGYRYDSCD